MNPFVQTLVVLVVLALVAVVALVALCGGHCYRRRQVYRRPRRSYIRLWRHMHHLEARVAELAALLEAHTTNHPDSQVPHHTHSELQVGEHEHPIASQSFALRLPSGPWLLWGLLGGAALGALLAWVILPTHWFHYVFVRVHLRASGAIDWTWPRIAIVLFVAVAVSLVLGFVKGRTVRVFSTEVNRTGPNRPVTP